MPLCDHTPYRVVLLQKIVFGPPTKEGKRTYIMTCVCGSVRPFVRPSVRSSVRLLPRYLQIALVDFYVFFRKDVTFANSERNVFGFLKKSFVFQILGKKNFFLGKNLIFKINNLYFAFF